MEFFTINDLFKLKKYLKYDNEKGKKNSNDDVFIIVLMFLAG